ncbi:hypothetical protein [Flavobacterium sedimenticola]|uniref:Lipocalin-like domain-containing protein n=1 Tax=Flavobacterium sedimenticola TaxID=3043286 RepID=A0ABT6XLU3_9FLAO|nr:hypothetical protein [Flavobacterium sedimenticola]MDI9256041.1 hypothetical protein [Flavobacterium sedimenticola]
MKIWIKYTAFFGLGIFLFTLLMSVAKSPEDVIEGEWKELVWEYEKTDWNKLPMGNSYGKDSGYIKEVAGQNLVIHKAEKWIFYPNGKLLLKGENYSKEIAWKIKGRGNILELKYDNNNTEHYSLTELQKDKLILNFDTSAHTRGIARLTFEKIN